MDEGSDSSSIWHRLTRVFHGKHMDVVEQAIRDARDDGQLDKEEGTMLLSVLSLDEMQVQDIMTPRTDIACAPHNATVRQLAEMIVASGHSRIPVFQENRDNIIGVVHAKDILQHGLTPSGQELLAETVMREPFFIPETKNVLDLLQEFRSRKNHLAVILDEYGGTAGLVSIEDVIEQIVGDIEDEHDAPRQEEITELPDQSFRILGRAYLEDVAERLHLDVSSEEVDTLGGFLSLLAGKVPCKGETFTLHGMRFTVEEADAKQVHTVRAEYADVPADRSLTAEG